jgi:uncharacterized RDD family membrane protein YckC
MSAPIPELRGQYAGFVSRLVAFLIDRGIIWSILAVTTAVTSYLFGLVGLSITECRPGPTFEGIVCLSVGLFLLFFTLTFAPIYTVVFWTLAGQTPGKYLLGLRVYRMDGERLTLTRSIRRYIGYILSFAAFGLGFLWITIDDERQGFHDIFADTCVVYSWDAFQNQRLINRLSMRLYRSRFFQNPEAFYASGMTEQDANAELADEEAPHQSADETSDA